MFCIVAAVADEPGPDPVRVPLRGVHVRLGAPRHPLLHPAPGEASFDRFRFPSQWCQNCMAARMTTNPTYARTLTPDLGPYCQPAGNKAAYRTGYRPHSRPSSQGFVVDPNSSCAVQCGNRRHRRRGKKAGKELLEPLAPESAAADSLAIYTDALCAPPRGLHPPVSGARPYGVQVQTRLHPIVIAHSDAIFDLNPHMTLNLRCPVGFLFLSVDSASDADPRPAEVCNASLLAWFDLLCAGQSLLHQ